MPILELAVTGQGVSEILPGLCPRELFQEFLLIHSKAGTSPISCSSFCHISTLLKEESLLGQIVTAYTCQEASQVFSGYCRDP